MAMTDQIFNLAAAVEYEDQMRQLESGSVDSASDEALPAVVRQLAQLQFRTARAYGILKDAQTLSREFSTDGLNEFELQIVTAIDLALWSLSQEQT